MTLPALITVNGIVGDSSGPQAGRIVWHRNLPLLPAAGDDLHYQIPEEIVSVVGVDGVLEQLVYATNDPACSPVGWTWTVTTHFPHWKQTFSVVVPYDAVGGAINFNRLAPVPPDEDAQLYALASHTHAGGGGGGTDITASQISDSTAVGRSVITGTAAQGRTALGLGGAAVLSVGTGSGNVAAGNAGIQALAAATAADVTTLATATAAIASSLAAHTAASDPHPQYLTAAEGNASYDAIGAATTALASATAADAAHAAASDPHTNYTSIYYWNGSSYSIVTAANVYVGGTGPVSPTNGDLVFTT